MYEPREQKRLSLRPLPSHIMKWLLPLALVAPTSLGALAVAAPRTIEHTSPPLKPGVTLLSNKVAGLLRDNNTKALSTYVDSSWGLRFSPEVYAQKEDVHLTRNQVAALHTDKKIRTWGDYDGEGGPIKLNWEGYRKRFIWTRDFTHNSQISVNRPLGGRSTVINNLRQFYPNSTFVEFYLPSTSQNTMDWQSLWLMWKKRGAAWRLIGIAHDQWST